MRVFFAITVINILLSCTNITYHEPYSQFISEKKGIKNIENRNQSIRNLYPRLTFQERISTWRGRVSEVLQKEHLNNGQKDFLINLQQNIQAIFDDAIAQDASLALQYQNKAILIFGKDKASLYFSSFYSSMNEFKQSTIRRDTLNKLDSLKECACSTKSDACFGFSNCENVNIACKGTSIGCGFLWLFECNGMCK